jgi:hypothetical protein
MKHLFTFALAFVISCTHTWAQDDKPAGCLVAHFKGMSLRTNDATQRARMAEEWLRKYISTCTKEQVAIIKSNSPDWLGTAHTHDVNMIIDASFETMAKGNPGQIAGLYESLAKERKSSTETFSSGFGPAPVVQAPIMNGGLAGNVNFGNVAGPASNVTTQNAMTNIAPIKIPSDSNSAAKTTN